MSNLFSSPSQVKNTRIQYIKKNIIDCQFENTCVSSRLFQRKDPESIVPEVITNTSCTPTNKVFDILKNLISRLKKYLPTIAIGLAAVGLLILGVRSTFHLIGSNWA